LNVTVIPPSPSAPTAKADLTLNELEVVVDDENFDGRHKLVVSYKI
jgi:hypothetical protein